MFLFSKKITKKFGYAKNISVSLHRFKKQKQMSKVR